MATKSRETHSHSPLSGRGEAATTFAYDGANKIKRIEDAVGRITSFTVDGSGDLTQVTTPELCVTQFKYESGQMVAHVDPEGNRTTFAYMSPS